MKYYKVFFKANKQPTTFIMIEVNHNENESDAIFGAREYLKNKYQGLVISHASPYMVVDKIH